MPQSANVSCPSSHRWESPRPFFCSFSHPWLTTPRDGSLRARNRDHTLAIRTPVTAIPMAIQMKVILCSTEVRGQPRRDEPEQPAVSTLRRSLHKHKTNRVLRETASVLTMRWLQRPRAPARVFRVRVGGRPGSVAANDRASDSNIPIPRSSSIPSSGCICRSPSTMWATAGASGGA
jgi:hypothetical protein